MRSMLTLAVTFCTLALVLSVPTRLGTYNTGIGYGTGIGTGLGTYGAGIGTYGTGLGTGIHTGIGTGIHTSVSRIASPVGYGSALGGETVVVEREVAHQGPYGQGTVTREREVVDQRPGYGIGIGRRY